MKRNNPILTISIMVAVTAAAVLAALTACNANFTAMDPTAGSTFAMRFSSPNTGGALPQSFGFNPLFNGESQVSGMFSVKYYITDIRLGGTADESGTGLNNVKEPYYISWQNTSGGYSFQGKTGDYTTAMGAADTKNYIDLMSDADLAKFTVSSPVIGQNIGEYNYAIISGLPVIKIKAQVNIGARMLYTKAAVTENKVDQGGGNYQYQYTAADLSVGPAEEMVIHFNGEANWSKLLKPFKITDEDLRNHVKYKLFLAWDPAGAIIGFDRIAMYSNNLDPNRTVNDFTANTNHLQVAWMDVAPVVYKEGQHVIRSTYVFSNVAGTAAIGVSNTNRVNLEIFTVQEDTSGSIYAVIDRTFSCFSNQTAPPGGIVKITLVSIENGKLTFSTPSETSRQRFVSDFTLLGTVGDTSTLTYHRPNAPGDPVPVPGLDYTLAEKVVVAQ